MRNIAQVTLIAVATLLLSFVSQQPKKYQVEILQDNKIVPVVNQVVDLEKKPFQIRISLYHQDGVFMSSSFNRDYYDLQDDQPIKDYKYLTAKTRIEENFNKDQELDIDDESVSYLFYDNEHDWHRFDKEIMIKKDTVIGKKTVTKIWIDETKKAIPLSKINKNIYLFFVATDNWVGDIIPKELGRTKIEIRWKQ